MTQQSLSIRLKAAHDALYDVLWAYEVRPSCQKNALEVCRCVKCATERARTARDDLRELIKEADEQEPVNPSKAVTDFILDKGSDYTQPLYTALGEKP